MQVLPPTLSPAQVTDLSADVSLKPEGKSIFGSFSKKSLLKF